MIRLARRIALIALAASVLLFGALVTIAYVYEDEVKARLVDALNAHLKTPLYQSGIELTLIKRFPQASLRIHDVLVREVRTDSVAADTLFAAQDLYLEFSLFALLSGNYTVSELHGQAVKLQPGLDANGAENWLIWRTDSTSGSGTGFALKKVSFDGLDLRYRDDRSHLEIAGASRRMAVRGRFRPEGSALETTGDLLLLHWRDANGVQLSDRKGDVKLTMAFGGADGAFRITKGEVLFGKTPLNVTLAVDHGARGRTMDLRANGFGLDLASVVALLPEALNRPLRSYGLDGEADVAVHYGGPLDGPGPVLSAGMKLREGRFREQSSGTVFKDVRGELAVELTPEGTPRKLVVRGFSAQCASGSLGGNVELNGLKQAKLTADLHGDLALADLLRFARVDTLEQVDGRLKAEAHITGKLRDVGRITPADLRALTISGTAQLKDASLKMKGVRHRITALNAELALRGNDALVNGLRCDVQGNAIELSGTLRNLMPYLLFPDQHLTIDARGRSPRVDLASLLTESTAAAGGSAYVFTLPALVDLDLKADVGELVMEAFSAQAISGSLRLQDQVLSIDPLSFRTAGGSVRGNIRLDGRPAGAYPLSIAGDVKGIDVTALFAEFQDFGQSFITQRHLKGRGDARFTFTAPLTPAFRLDEDRLHCVADVVVENGELNGHASLLEVAGYLEKNKLVSPFVDTDALRERLQHVTFARLENRIEIKDRNVYLPQMLVQSSVMDIEVSGAHGFDGTVDDHLNFRLGDLFRTADSGHDEFGPIIDDGTGLRIFLHMYGTTSALQFGNDGAMAAARRKEKMKQETAELKGILKGIWTGTKPTAAPPAQPQGRITIEPARPAGGPEGGTDAPAETRTATRPKKGGLGRLLEKGKDDEEQETIILE